MLEFRSISGYGLMLATSFQFQDTKIRKRGLVGWYEATTRSFERGVPALLAVSPGPHPRASGCRGHTLSHRGTHSLIMNRLASIHRKQVPTVVMRTPRGWDYRGRHSPARLPVGLTWKAASYFLIRHGGIRTPDLLISSPPRYH